VKNEEGWTYMIRWSNCVTTNNNNNAGGCGQVECEVKDEEEVDVQFLMERLRHHVLVNRIRVKEFFQDFDPLNSGTVTRARYDTIR